MSFIFADLIVTTITDAYRRYYGWRLAAVLFGTIFVCTIISGIFIHYIWHAIVLNRTNRSLGKGSLSAAMLACNASPA